MNTRFYVNFASLVDGTIFCKYFKTEKEAEKFAVRLNIKCYYSVNINEYTKDFIDGEIWQSMYNENYLFQPETHYYFENRIVF